jgi:hypothetical protein
MNNIPCCSTDFGPLEREVLPLPIPVNGVHLTSGRDTILASVFEGFQIEFLSYSESVFLGEKLTAVLRTTSSGSNFLNFCVTSLSNVLRFFHVQIFLPDKKLVRLFVPFPEMSVRIFYNREGNKMVNYALQ